VLFQGPRQVAGQPLEIAVAGAQEDPALDDDRQTDR
jgi:hypothetical protein